jgi:MFS family permease
LFPKNLFKLLSFNLANVTHFLIGAALIIGMVTVPLLAATVLEKSPLEGGLQLLRMTVAIGFGALIGGYITQRIGERSPVIIGTIITGMGFLLMSEWTLNIAEPTLTIHLAITGLGLGLVISPITETALGKVNSDQRGIASALLSSSRMIGMIAGLAVMTALGTAQFHELLVDIPAFSIDPNVQQHIADSAVDAGMKVFTRFYQYGAVICFLALIPAWTMTKKRRDQLTDES